MDRTNVGELDPLDSAGCVPFVPIIAKKLLELFYRQHGPKPWVFVVVPHEESNVGVVGFVSRPRVDDGSERRKVRRPQAQHVDRMVRVGGRSENRVRGCRLWRFDGDGPSTAQLHAVVDGGQGHQRWEHFHKRPRLHGPKVEVHVVSRVALHAQCVNGDQELEPVNVFPPPGLCEDAQ